MVDTMEPVSTRQGTFTPPMSTSKWGQDEINPEVSKLRETACEPVAAPTKLWVCSSVGTSFLTWNESEIVDQHSRGVVRETVN